jgi:hypothetical protein
MNKFIWVRDRDKCEHYINIDHIVRVTKVESKQIGYSDYAYLVLNDVREGSKSIDLSKDDFDTYQDVINKIQVAQS